MKIFRNKNNSSHSLLLVWLFMVMIVFVSMSLSTSSMTNEEEEEVAEVVAEVAEVVAEKVVSEVVPVVLQEETVAATDTAVVMDCDMICQDMIQPYINVQTTQSVEKEFIMKQLQDMTTERDELQQTLQIIQSELQQTQTIIIPELHTSMERTKHELQISFNTEIDTLQTSLTAIKEEMTHYQKVAQDNQRYMQEYKNELHSQRDKSNKLSISLQEAKAIITELESTTFVKQLRKEIIDVMETIKIYWINLTNNNNNKKTSDAEEEF